MKRWLQTGTFWLIVVLFNTGERKKKPWWLLLGWNLTCWLTGNMTQCENLCLSVLLPVCCRLALCSGSHYSVSACCHTAVGGGRLQAQRRHLHVWPCVDEASFSRWCAVIFPPPHPPNVPVKAFRLSIVWLPRDTLWSLLQPGPTPLGACYCGDSVSYFAVRSRYSSARSNVSAGNLSLFWPLPSFDPLCPQRDPLGCQGKDTAPVIHLAGR